MPPDEELRQFFPDVDGKVLDDVVTRIEGRGQTPTAERVAAVLDALADRGVVASRDYAAQVRRIRDDAASAESIPDEWAEEIARMGFDPDQARRGMEAERRAKERPWLTEVQGFADRGDVSSLVDFFNDLARVADESMASPQRAGLPGDTEEAGKYAINTLSDLIERRASRRDVDALDQMLAHIQRIESEPARAALEEEVIYAKGLLSNGGTEFDEARAYVLDEDNSLDEMERRLREVLEGRFDVNYEQFTRLNEAAREWLDEYEAAAREAGATSGDS